jgi:hypothetical protein
MLKKLISGLAAVLFLLAGCARETPTPPPSTPPQPSTSLMVEVTPAPLDAAIPGTSYKEGFARSCNPDTESVNFTQADIQTRNGSGVAERTVKGGRIIYDLTKGLISDPSMPDTAAITFEGQVTPVAVVVNSRLSASLAGIPEKTIVIPGETFAPDAEGKINGIKICYS